MKFEKLRKNSITVLITAAANSSGSHSKVAEASSDEDALDPLLDPSTRNSSIMYIMLPTNSNPKASGLDFFTRFEFDFAIKSHLHMRYKSFKHF
jgi:hypothetical protein